MLVGVSINAKYLVVQLFCLFARKNVLYAKTDPVRALGRFFYNEHIYQLYNKALLNELLDYPFQKFLLLFD